MLDMSKPSDSPPGGQQRLGGHVDDYDELSWHLTYRAAKAVNDTELPQSPAEAKFVEQMLGNEPVTVAAQTVVRSKAKVWPWVLACLLVVLTGIVAIQGLLHPTRPIATVPDFPPAVPPLATPAPGPTGPSYSLAPYDRRGVDVIAEMLAIAEGANPGLIWFTSQTPELTDCTLPNGQDGEVASLTIRWGMGDYDAIQTGPVEGNAEWHMIQQLNDAADDKMLEAWVGHPVADGAYTQSAIDALHGNWYFGYIFPGLSGGSSTFDLHDGVGILQLETLCLQPSSPEAID